MRGPPDPTGPMGMTGPRRNPRGRSHAAGRNLAESRLGMPVDSVTTSRARVAALSRHRSKNDPDIAEARKTLVRSRDTERARRALSQLTPEDREQLLAGLEGAPSV